MSDITDGIKELKKNLAGKKSDVVVIRAQDIILPEKMTKQDIKNVRKIMGLSQSIFGKLMGVPTVTIQKWENGKNHPRGPARRLMQLFLRYPAELKEEILTFN